MDAINPTGPAGLSSSPLTSRLLTQSEADEFLVQAVAQLQQKFGASAAVAQASEFPAASEAVSTSRHFADGPPAPQTAPPGISIDTSLLPEAAGVPTPDQSEWVGVLQPPADVNNERLEYICRSCNAIFPRQPILRRGPLGNVIQCPACQSELWTAFDRDRPPSARIPASPRVPSSRRLVTAARPAPADQGAARRAVAYRKTSARLNAWRGDVPPEKSGARLMEVITHADARRVAAELTLFRPRAFFGLGPIPKSPGDRDRGSSRGNRLQQVPLDPDRLAALIDFRRHRQAQDQLPDRNSELIHPGTRVLCACGSALRFETTGSGAGHLRLVASGGRGTHAGCNLISTIRVSVLGSDSRTALADRLSDPAWAGRLYQVFAKVLRRARVHHRRAAASVSQRRTQEGPGSERPDGGSLDTEFIPWAGPHGRRGPRRALRTLIARIHQLPRASEPHVLSPPIKLEVRKFARRLEGRRLHKGLPEARFVEQAAMTAGLLDLRSGSPLQLDRLIDSVVIRVSAASPDEPGSLRATITLRHRELLKLILPAMWHRVIDQFATGLLRITIPIGQPATRDALTGPVQHAVSLGDSQQVIGSDFGISQSQVSLLARAAAPDMLPWSKIPLVDRVRIRLAQRRAEVRRSLTLSPLPWTAKGDDARIRRLSEGLRRLKSGLDPFSEVQASAAMGPAPAGFHTGRVWSPATVASPGPVAGEDSNSQAALLTILPLTAEDVGLVSSLLTRRADGEVSGAPDELWRRLQAHVFDRGSRPACRADQRLAMRLARATLARFRRGQIEPSDQVLGALILRELGGWTPILIDAMEIAGYSSYLIEPRLGLLPGVVPVYRALFGRLGTRDRSAGGPSKVIEGLRALLIGEAQKGRESFEVFLTAMRALGRLPATVNLGSSSPMDRGELLAQELVFQRAWITPTDRNAGKLNRLERRIAEFRGKQSGKRPHRLEEVVAMLSGGGSPR